ncbi:MAG TPA: SgcJ/EcaC family oxidoreductase, partial [Gemmataceae bacterium]|nr:SgcJ/EcaC family oxidoreductase [Gemmataceae bacterium]
MRGFLLSIALLAGMVIVVSPTVQSHSDSKKQATPADEQKQEKGAKKRAADRSADEAAIRANVTAFVKAYNAKDAKAIAAMFTPDGLIVDKEGDASEGREAIQKVFSGMFAESPKKQIEVTIESIRFVGADLAMEEGTTKETAAPGEIPEYDGYTVLHVKRDGKWLMAMARDEEGPPPSSHEQLRPLAWLVGEWVDDGGSVVVNSTCRWSEDGNFLLQEFNIQVSGKNAMRVSQRIGWDPQAKSIR